VSAEILSQEELDALLSAGDFSQQVSSETDSEILPSTAPSTEQKKVSQEFISLYNEAFNSAVIILNTILNQTVNYKIIFSDYISKEKLTQYLSSENFLVDTNYEVGLNGKINIIMNDNIARYISDVMMGGEGEVFSGPFDDLKQSAINEAINQIINSISTYISNKAKNIQIANSLPQINLYPDVIENIKLTEAEFFTIVFQLQINDKVSGNLLFLFSNELLNDVNNKLFKKEEEKESSAPYKEEKDLPEKKEEIKKEKPKTERDEFENIRLLVDVPLTIRVVLGKNKLLVKDILELGSGSIIELNKMANEYVDLFIEDKLIAKGEVVVIDENFGVRIINILTPEERVELTKAIK